MKLYQISGPDWLRADRFDIAATFPPGAPISQFTNRMQSLIAKGGLKMQESGPDPNAEDARAPINITGGGNSQGVSINLGRGSSYTSRTTSSKPGGLRCKPWRETWSDSWIVPLWI